MIGMDAATYSVSYKTPPYILPEAHIPGSGPETGMGACCFLSRPWTLCTPRGLSASPANVFTLHCSL